MFNKNSIPLKSQFKIEDASSARLKTFSDMQELRSLIDHKRETNYTNTKLLRQKETLNIPVLK